MKLLVLAVLYVEQQISFYGSFHFGIAFIYEIWDAEVDYEEYNHLGYDSLWSGR